MSWVTKLIVPAECLIKVSEPMSPVVKHTRAALAAFLVALMGIAIPVEAQDEVDLGARYRVLDACFGTKLTEASKNDKLGEEADAMILKLFKAEDLYERISCLQFRERELLAAEDGSLLTPYKFDPANTVKMDDWDRVRELDACLHTDFAGASRRKEKAKVEDEYVKMKKAIILAPELSPLISCMEDREIFGKRP